MAWMANSLPSLEMSTTISSRFAHTVWTDDEPSIGILAEIVDDESVRDGMGDVVVVHAASSRSMDLHTPISYYEMQSAGQPRRFEMSAIDSCTARVKALTIFTVKT